MILKIVATILLTLLGAVAYRMGGSDKYNTKVRDLGVPTVGIGLLWLLGGWNWWLIACFGLYFGSLTTYWTPKHQPDVLWQNWLFVGIGFSLAYLPYVIATSNWVGFGIRTLLVSAGVMVWSEKVSNPVWEELGRGAITTGTIPLLLI